MDENRKIQEKLVRHTAVEQDLGHGLKHQTVRYIDYETPREQRLLRAQPVPRRGTGRVH